MDVAGMIDLTKWADLEFVRFRNYMYRSQGPHEGFLESALTRYGSNGSNYLVFYDPSSVNSFQADVTVRAYQNNGSYPHASLLGHVYNDGTGTSTPGDLTGDVIGAVGIGHNGTQLEGFYSISRCTAPNCNLPNEVQLLCSGRIRDAALDTLYQLSFSWDGSKFTFGVGDTFIDTSDTSNPNNHCPNLPQNAGSPKGQVKGIGTRITNISNGSNEGGYICCHIR